MRHLYIHSIFYTAYLLCNTMGQQATGEHQTPELAITMKANLTFVASTLFTRIATPKIFDCIRL